MATSIDLKNESPKKGIAMDGDTLVMTKAKRLSQLLVKS